MVEVPAMALFFGNPHRDVGCAYTFLLGLLDLQLPAAQVKTRKLVAQLALGDSARDQRPQGHVPGDSGKAIEVGNAQWEAVSSGCTHKSVVICRQLVERRRRSVIAGRRRRMLRER